MQALLDENINSTEVSGSSKNEWFTEQTYSHYCPSGPRNFPELSQESYRTSIYTDTTQDHRSTCDHSSTYDGSLLIRSPSCSADFIRIKSQPVVPPTSNSPSSPTTDSPLSFKSPKMLHPFTTTLKSSTPSNLDSSAGSGSTSKRTMMSMRNSSLKAVYKENEGRNEDCERETVVQLKNIPQNIPTYEESYYVKEEWGEEYERQKRKEEEEEQVEEEVEQQEEMHTEIRFSALQIQNENMLPYNFQESVKTSPFKDLKIKENNSFSSQRYGFLDYTDNDDFTGENIKIDFDDNSLKNLYSLHNEYFADSAAMISMAEEREKYGEGGEEREVGRELRMVGEREGRGSVIEIGEEEGVALDLYNYQNSEKRRDIASESHSSSDDLLSSYSADFTEDIKEHYNREENSFREEHSFREGRSLNDSHMSGQTQFWMLSDSDEDDAMIGTCEDYESTCLFDDSR